MQKIRIQKVLIMKLFGCFVLTFAIFKVAYAKYVGSDKMSDNMIVDESDEVSENTEFYDLV